jgi:hypothetical protein
MALPPVGLSREDNARAVLQVAKVSYRMAANTGYMLTTIIVGAVSNIGTVSPEPRCAKAH